MSFKMLDKEPIGRLRKPDPRMPRWLVVLLGAVAREGWRAARRGNDAQAACGIALLGVLAGIVVRNMTDTLLVRQNALLFWGVVAVLLGFSSRPWRSST